MLNYGLEIIVMFFFVCPAFPDFGHNIIKGIVQGCERRAGFLIIKRDREIIVIDAFQKRDQFSIGPFHKTDQIYDLPYDKNEDQPCRKGKRNLYQQHYQSQTAQ
jgi:hypothetical protein